MECIEIYQVKNEIKNRRIPVIIVLEYLATSLRGFYSYILQILNGDIMNMNKYLETNFYGRIQI